jgi:DNA-directed RNA polymerase subunit beta
MEDTPKYTVMQCKERDATYAAPLKVRVQLVNRETMEVKEQEIFMGDFPLMTESGTFIINGAERVIVSQLVRSPGIYYDLTRDKSGTPLYSTTIIPNRGAWIEYETDSAGVYYVRIDKNRKIPATVLMRCFGLETDEQLIDFFGNEEHILATIEKDPTKNTDDALLELYRKLRPGEPPTVESSRSLLNSMFFDVRRYDLPRVGRFKYNQKMALAPRIAGRILAEPVVNPLTAEVVAEADGRPLTKEMAKKIERSGVSMVRLRVEDAVIKVFSNGMVDLDAFVEITPEECAERGLTEKVSFKVLNEILEEVGDSDHEALLNALSERIDDLIPKHIIVDDVFASFNYLVCLSYDIGTTDDIDHLGNRRIRCVGELLQNQFRIGLSRMERVIRERMTTQNLDVITPQALINIRPVVAAIKEFFGSSPLSQFLDQTTPLA